MRKPNSYAGPIPANQRVVYFSPITMPPSRPQAIEITVKGDCGIIHQSFEQWQACKVCEWHIKRRLD